MSLWRRAHAIALLALVYLITARLCFAVHEVNDVASLAWAPTAIAFGAALLHGRWLWPGAAIGAFATTISNGFGIEISLWVAVIDVIEILIGVTLLQRLSFRPALDEVRSVLLLVGTSIVMSIAGVMIGIAGVLVAGVTPSSPWMEVWSTWWWGHLAGFLIVTPLLLSWGVRSPLRRETRPHVLEAVALGASLLVVEALIMQRWLPQSLSTWHAPFYLLPLMLWTALRFGARGASLGNVGVNVLLIVGVTLGYEPYRDLEDMQSFIAVSSVTTLTVSSLALERLRATQRKAAILDAALDAIVTVDTNDHIVEFNPAAEELFGYREEDVLGRSLAGLVVKPALVEPYHRLLAAFAQGDAPPPARRIRSTALRADGQEVPVELSLVRVPLADQFLVTGFVRDVTAERAADQARREARELLESRVQERTQELVRTNLTLARREQLLRDAEALAHLGSFDLDLDAGVLEWSDEMYRIYGRVPGSFTPTYQSFLASVHPDDRERIDAIATRAISEGTRFAFEARIVHPDGSIRYVQTQAFIVADETGQRRRVLGCGQDVTERTQAQEQLTRLGELVEASQDAIIGLDPSGTIRSWNPGAERLFGYTTGEIVGHSCNDLMPAEHRDKLGVLLDAVRTGPLSRYELPHVRKDGTMFEGAVSLSAILDSDGRLSGFSKVIRDISDQKHAELELRASLAEKEVLLREIHHRVKNNLQVISSLLNLQASSELGEETRQRLLESQNRIQSMALVHQLLYQSRGLATIDVGDYLRGLTSRLVQAYSLHPHRIDVSIQVPAVSLDVDRAIPCGLIVNELLTNALIHAFPGDRRGHVWITLAREHGELVLGVHDDGVGMRVEVDLEHMSSFGLQIARLLAHQLGGSMSLTTTGRGTSVSVHFPEWPAAQSASVH